MLHRALALVTIACGVTNCVTGSLRFDKLYPAEDNVMLKVTGGLAGAFGAVIVGYCGYVVALCFAPPPDKLAGDRDVEL
jgi:hypothetical protein